MRKERLLILLGILVALIFFYVGLNKWLESKPESAPPPVVVKPTPKPPAQLPHPKKKKPRKNQRQRRKSKLLHRNHKNRKRT
jgi:hypothetical protein